MIKPENYRDALVCPKCRSKIVLSEGDYVCTDSLCLSRYPLVSGVPIFINEENSAFKISDFIAQKENANVQKKTQLVDWANKLIPSLNLNVTADENIRKFKTLVLDVAKDPKLLILGCRAEGQGIRELQDSRLVVFNTYVSLGNSAAFVVDAHDIPFEDEFFDGVIIQTVLEHVADPARCVSEIHRVLRPVGVVYSETSFNQQIHMGAYDFTRFTHVGHRRLFRMFSEVESGIGSGPGMALAWAYQYFLLSFTSNRTLRLFKKVFSRLTGFWLKYFDYLLARKSAALDAAATCYFIGRKSDTPMCDNQVINEYRGLF